MTEDFSAEISHISAINLLVKEQHTALMVFRKRTDRFLSNNVYLVAEMLATSLLQTFILEIMSSPNFLVNF
jgi:hypothetical protein